MSVPEKIIRSDVSDIGLCSRYVAYIDVATRIGDAAIVLVTGLAAHLLRFGTPATSVRYRVAITVAVLLTLLFFPALKVYRSWRGDRLTTEIGRVWLAWAAVAIATLTISWALKATDGYSREWLALWFGGAAVVFAGHRMAGRMTLGWVRARGIDARRVLLVGATHAGKRIVDTTRDNPHMGLNVTGYIATPYDQVAIAGLPSEGTLDPFITRADVKDYDQVWIALPMHAEADIRRLNQALNDTAVTVRFVPDLFGYELLNQQSAQVGGLPVITLRGSRITGYARLVKGIEDRVLAALILLLISPLLVVLALGVKLSSPGPVLFKQKRLGLGSKPVEVWKFRSMRVHTEAPGIVTQCVPGDPRTTRFGRFMRRFSLDELPQFINVAMGTMSIVGPRPHAVEHDHYYRALIRDYAQRHQVKPGITGWAQIHGLRGETNTVDKMAARIQYDMDYIRDWSLWLDLCIIARTVVVMFPGKNAY